MQSVDSLVCGRCRESTKPRLPQLRPIESRFLRSSYVASNEEARSLISLLQEEKEGISWYEKEMARVRQWLQELEAGKQALESHIQRRRSALSAQRRVPVEIWEIIFDMVSKPPDQDGYSLDIYYYLPYRRQLSMNPVTLSHVCSRWRDIALGYPKLWSSIRLVFRDIPVHAHDVLRTFVHNSKGYPLEICVSAKGSEIDPDKKCWEVLSEQFGWCSELVVESWGLRTFLETVSVPRVAFANLVVFKAIATPEDIIQPGHWLSQALRCAPKLAKIRTPVVSPISSLPYPQLTELKIEWLYPAQFRDFIGVLRVSMNLRTLVIGALAQAGEDFDLLDAPGSTVRLPFLQTLVIDRDAGGESLTLEIIDPHFICLFNSLEMPSLHTLRLRYREPWWDSGVPWPPSLLSMLSRSSYSLRRLTMCVDTFNGTLQPLSVLLQTVPNLVCFGCQVVLNLDRDDEFDPSLGVIDDYVSSFLSDLISRNNLMPNLNALCFQFHEMSLKNLNIVGRTLELAKARSPSSVMNTPGLQALTDLRLERFRYGLLPEPVLGSIEEMETLEALRRDGVSIDLKDVEASMSSLIEEADRLWM